MAADVTIPINSFDREPQIVDDNVEHEQQRKLALFNKYFALTSVGSKMVIAEINPRTRQVIQLWDLAQFRTRTSKHFVTVVAPTGSPKQKPLSAFWMSHSEGRRFTKLQTVPPGAEHRLEDGAFNLWHGFAVQPKAGDWSKNKAHIRDIICAGDDGVFHWVMNWMAALVQKPGLLPRSAILMQGGQGTGKGWFAHNMLGSLFHEGHYIHLIGGSQLTGRFNDHLSGKVLVFADEAIWSHGAGEVLERLKALISETFVSVERKFLSLVSEPSMMHIIISTNSDNPIAIERDDRRFLVLRVSEEQKNNEAYFSGLRTELQAGGREAMLAELLKHPLDEATLRHPPMTAQKAELKTLSLDREHRWLQGWLMNPERREGHRRWDGRIIKAAMHSEYQKYALDTSHQPPKTEVQFGMFLSKLFKRGGSELISTKVDGRNAYHFPSLAEFRAIFDKAAGTSTEWSEPETGPTDLEVLHEWAAETAA